MPMNRQQLPTMSEPDMPEQVAEIRSPERSQKHEARSAREAER